MTVVRGLTALGVATALALGGSWAAPAQADAATTRAKVSAAAKRRAAQRAAAVTRSQQLAAHRAAVRQARLAAQAKAKARRGVKATGWRSAKVSWYGPGFYGRGMAGGGKLLKTSVIVAHRTLPFGTRVEFSYKGRTVIAVVKDRGPFVRGRVFDLGPGTARALQMYSVGTVRYRILG